MTHAAAPLRPSSRPSFARSNGGASLIVVMLILVVVSILGVSGIQVAMMGERGTRNDRDQQVAWQAAEAALMDAEFDIEGLPASSASKRNTIFNSKGLQSDQVFIQDCGNSGQSIGLCNLNITGKPAWLTVDFTATGATAPTVQFGTFTDRTFPAGAKGVQPVRAPRYVIEPIPDPQFSRTKAQNVRPNVYRVTAMGFGPNVETQAVVQMTYRN